MAYNVMGINEIDINNIKLGKTFKYSSYNDNDYNLINLYYINKNLSDDSNNLNNSNKTHIIPESLQLPEENNSKKQESNDDKTKLIIQTPLMYIPKSIIHFNNKPFVELSFNNEDNDKDVLEFKNWISNLEDYLYKLIKKRTSLNTEKKNMCSVLKISNNGNSNNGNSNDNDKNNSKNNSKSVNNNENKKVNLLVPININISKCILNEDYKNVKSKILFKWDIPVPTYAISIIWIKNIWIKNDKCGINLFMYASRVMNSHILDPINFMDSTDNNKSIQVNDITKHFKDDKKEKLEIGQMDEYAKYFKMIKMGIPKDAVKQKLILLNLDPRIIDYPDKTPYITVMHHISNPKPNSSNEENNNSTLSNTDITNTNTSNKIKLNNIDLLNNINNNTIKLKKTIINDKTLNTSDSSDSKSNKSNSKSKLNKLKVPSLDDIKNALSNLKKHNFESNV